MKTFLSVGQAAKILGVSISTMRRWEKEGKLLADKRTFGFHRRYEKEKLEKKEERFSVQGHKGSGGYLYEDGYSIYGFDSESRHWCEEQIKEHYNLVFDNILSIEFENKKHYLNSNLQLLTKINGIEKFFDTFYYSPKYLKEEVLSNNNDPIISFPAITGKNKEEFLNMYDKAMINFRDKLEKELDNRIKTLDTLHKISHRYSSGTIFVDGDKRIQRDVNILYLFEEELKKNPITVMYKNVLQNKTFNDNLVFFNYYKKKKLLTFEYRNILFSINLPDKLSHNFGHSLRKIMKSNNFVDLLRKLHNFSIRID